MEGKDARYLLCKVRLQQILIILYQVDVSYSDPGTMTVLESQSELSGIRPRNLWFGLLDGIIYK